MRLHLLGLIGEAESEFERVLRTEVERVLCSCIDIGGGVRITGHCPVHDPILRMLRGEHVEFHGLRAVLGGGS